MGSKEHRKGNSYLDMYPKLRKWIQQCQFCQMEGYNPDMPDVIGISSAGPANIRSMFPPLALDKEGVCDQCRAALFNQG